MGKYLSLYEQWMKTGQIPDEGLCNVFGYYRGPLNRWVSNDPFFPLFVPTEDELGDETYGIAHLYWASGLPNSLSLEYDDYVFGFTDLRQTIVLFMSAMNDEL